MTKTQDVVQVEDYKEDDPKLDALFNEAVKNHSEITSMLVVGNKVGYLKDIDRNTLEVALGYMMKVRGNPELIRAGEIIITNCWVTGDEEIRTNPKFYTAAAMQASELIEQKSSFLKKRK